MRTIEYLAQLFPDKTGKELFEIQKNDKLNDEKEFQRRNKSKLKIIEDINTNGGYFKGTFGRDQYFYYSFTNLKLIDGDIYCDVEDITCFNNSNRNGIHIETRESKSEKFERFGTSIYERVTKDDFEKVKNYIKNTFSLHWQLIDQTKF